MNVMIMTDLEGISGVDTMEMIQADNPEGYRYACQRLMADINAAVEGCLDAGADDAAAKQQERDQRKSDNGDAEANEAFLEFGQSHGFPRRRFDGHPCEAWKEQQCRYGLPPGQGNHPGNGREIKEENAKRPRGEEPGAVLRARRVRRSARFG